MDKVLIKNQAYEKKIVGGIILNLIDMNKAYKIMKHDLQNKGGFCSGVASTRSWVLVCGGGCPEDMYNKKKYFLDHLCPIHNTTYFYLFSLQCVKRY